MNRVMKELKKPKFLIVLILLMIYVLSKVETREWFNPFKAKSWKRAGNGAVKGIFSAGKGTVKSVKKAGKGAIKGINSAGKGAIKGIKSAGKTRYEKKLEKQVKECNNDYDKLMKAYTGYMKKNPASKTARVRF